MSERFSRTNLDQTLTVRRCVQQAASFQLATIIREVIVLYNFLAELQEFDTNMDNDSVSHLFTESPEDGREPDDIHMPEDSDASENESDSSCDFKVCRILLFRNLL